MRGLLIHWHQWRIRETTLTSQAFSTHSSLGWTPWRPMFRSPALYFAEAGQLLRNVTLGIRRLHRTCNDKQAWAAKV